MPEEVDLESEQEGLGQGKYKEPTKPIRVPESLISGLWNLLKAVVTTHLYSCSVQAGFPSPQMTYGRRTRS